ncbi:MAG: hypothetical protein PUH29_01115, partial [Lachnospiraceae bacterium]|nr:hypothetical protein [Lachnospiraceae bacterium]
IIDALADGCSKGANQTGMSLNYGRGTIDVHISVNRRADSADIGVTFPESSAYNSAQTACFY